jgi:hypothetical protein
MCNPQPSEKYLVLFSGHLSNTDVRSDNLVRDNMIDAESISITLERIPLSRSHPSTPTPSEEAPPMTFVTKRSKLIVNLIPQDI